MKKLKKIFLTLSLIATINLTFTFISNAAICFNGDCSTVVIVDDYGYSWFIYCEDGSYASGRTAGAEYGGSCAIN
jgi:hypothetical protein